ncbi:glycosyltransferase family 2 protein [Beijerinckia sp. L45]|uniref:glycosyltransferase family 2 protein n=1 Tax=Beijerinckia sp. L45 TaxID=1641855 RepID=UPI00131ABF09|nr:glycosyltransferase [Beijerinckia sp. L45]
MATIAVCVATTGRPDTVTEALRHIGGQTSAVDRVLVCPAKDGDIDRSSLEALGFAVEIVRGAPGLAAQRNTLLRAADAVDIILFIDDDFFAAPTYVAAMRALFAARPDCVVATGTVIADGVVGPGYSVAEARAILAAHAAGPATDGPIFTAYGCNMALRWATLRGTGCWFDEHLPLYAWAEDVDFSRQAAAFGDVRKSSAMIGVHLATKTGRVSGRRFGYSQIANQAYLVRKGTLPLWPCVRKAAENLAANVVGAVRNNEAYIDRRGRLAGNLYGLRDLIIGRSSPQRILTL